jgi:hypothetical protein
MALTETQVEVSKDPTGLITRTTTKQAFAWEDPSDDSRSYRVTQTDGVVTVVEEFFDVMPPVYALDVSTTQEPVESHPYFSSLSGKNRADWAMWKQSPNNPDLNGWQPSDETDEVFSTLYALWLKGITNYLAPRIVIKLTTLETEEPNVSEVGIISNPGYSGDTGPVNFILTGLSGQQEGAKWRVTREFLGSARGTNWEAVLYT